MAVSGIAAHTRCSTRSSGATRVRYSFGVEALKSLQRDIEAGQRVLVVGHTIEHGAHVRVPLHRNTNPQQGL